VFVSDREMEIIKQIRRGTASEKYDPENVHICYFTSFDIHI
jgi:hypothetical protein